MWYTPLLLSARVPEAMRVTLPCHRVAPLTRSSERTVVLATVRRADSSATGLVITQTGRSLTARTGSRVLVSVPLERESTGQCSYELDIHNGRWTVTGGPRQTSLSGELGFMPEVNGLFSAVDLNSDETLNVRVTTQPHETEATQLLTAARVIAALAALLALAIFGLGHRPLRALHRVGKRARGAVAALRWVDAAVVSVLLGWWVLAPAHWDDGWVAARQGNFSGARGFSNYYDSLGSNLPNGYWLEWLQHWVTQSSSTVLVLRVPALLSLIGTWLITRWALARVLPLAHRFRVVTWAAAVSFLAGALAWGMTLRPEPFTSLLVTLAFACAIAFFQTGSAAALAVAACVLPLAATGHHAGLLAAAPLVAIGPQLIQWVRRNQAAATTLATASFALLLLLAFLAADVAVRSGEAHYLSSYGVPDAWFDELRRYARLSDFHGGPPLRRASFAIMVLAVLAFALRRVRGTHRLRDIPSTALAIGFVLLIAVPSKWPWHFGALIGITAVAVAIETHRIRSDDARPRGWQARWLLVVAAVAVAIAWSWGPREHWTLLDVMSFDWRPDRVVSLSLVAVFAPVLFSIIVAALLKRRGDSPSDAPWRVASFTAPMLLLPIIIFTTVVLVADAARADWTLARQNLGSLRGSVGCGLADQILILEPTSVAPLSSLNKTTQPTVPSWVPPSPEPNLARFPLRVDRDGSAKSPWFDARGRERVGLYVSGYRSPHDRLDVEWGSLRANRVRDVRSSEWSVDAVTQTAGVTPWLFVPADALPPRPQGADVVRVRFRGDAGSGSTVSVTAPVEYRNQQLSDALRQAHGPALISPAFRTYIPCARLPSLGDGLAQPPRYIVSPDGVWLPDPNVPAGYRTSPFRGASDLYDVERVSIVDSPRPMPITVWRVSGQITGGQRLSPFETQTS
jgi:hypothetical protein